MSGSEAAFSLSSSPEPPEEPNGSSSNAQASSSTAPTRTFPTTAFAAVEYPGSVSHPSALLKVITQDDMNECFNAPTKETKMLEMKYGGDERDGIPVRGLRVASQKLLLKVTKRRRREDQMEKGKGKAIDGGEQGVFTAEIIGPITQTVRFRAMADYHYTPNPNGRVSQLVGVLKDLDYDAILDYTVPPLNEEFSEPVTPPFEEDIDENYEPQFRSLLDLQPLPIFSDRRMPFIYNFKQHNQSVMEEVEDPRTGLTKQRMINRGRFNGFALPKIGHSGVTPLKPVKELEKKIPNMDQRILARLRELLQDKPIWSRPALLALFNATDRKVIVEGKAYLPAVAYSFGAGPFWKCLVRYGFDPRQDSSTAIWQRIYFYFNVARGGRNAALESDDEEEDAAVAGTKSKNEWRAAQENRVAEGKRPPLDKNRAHIFDGVLLHSDTADFQLCDIHDEQIRKYIDDPSNLTEVCDPQVGWYKPEAMTLIKSLTRIKYEHLRDTDQPAPMSLCYQVIEDFERAKLGARGAEEAVAGEDVEME